MIHAGATTWVDVLRRYVDADAPPRFTFEHGADVRTFGLDVLARASFAAGARMTARGVGPGERVIVLAPPSPELFCVFFGSIASGNVPVMVALPGNLGGHARYRAHLLETSSYVAARFVVAPRSLAEELGPLPDGLTVLTTESIVGDPASARTASYDAPRLDPSAAAFIQCTSGSTGRPKGVVLSHANLLANTSQIARALELRTGLDKGVCWLPWNHDMGLIGNVLTPLARGMDMVYLRPSDFLRRPSRWLDAMSRHRATISAAPCFAYAHATRRAPANDAGLDLASVRVMLCGAEPIDAAVLDAFLHRYAPRGLREEALVPCYGLAEASLAVSIDTPRAAIVTESVDRERLASHAEAVRTDGTNAQRLVGCGRAVEGTDIRVVGADLVPLADGQVGRIRVRGPSVMQGYHALPDVTSAVLTDEWLDTGDLGYLRDGVLFVTGRSKDLILIRGRCHAPSEFEWAAESVEGVHSGGVVAFGVADASEGTEQLHVVCETGVPEGAERDALARRVVAEITERTGVAPTKVHLVRRFALPKTTSGKVRRDKTRALLAEGRPVERWRV